MYNLGCSYYDVLNPALIYIKFVVLDQLHCRQTSLSLRYPVVGEDSCWAKIPLVAEMEGFRNILREHLCESLLDN